MTSHRYSAAVQARQANNIPAADQLPDTLQWMPPGVSEIQASRAGEPVRLTVIVDLVGAQRVQSSFLAMKRAADVNQGDYPYLDLNHDDREAAGWPSEFYWAGDDPQTGGIRVRVEWSWRGKEAILGKLYRRFSPSFYVDASGFVTGIPCNCGGLVNRAAFSRIQPLLSNQGNPVEKQTPELLAEAKALSASSAMELDQAITAIAHTQPQLYDEYRAGLLGVTQTARAVAPSLPALPFIAKAALVAHERGVSVDEGMATLAKANPRSYRQYRETLMGFSARPDPAEAQIEQAKATENLPFVIAARALAVKDSIDPADAALIVARSNPAFYESYRQSLLSPQESPAVTATEPELMLTSRVVAAQRHVTLEEALGIVARERPELYEDFRSKL